jgi:hypothetical protein
MRGQAGTGTDPGARAGAAPLAGDFAAGSPAVPGAERGRSGPARRGASPARRRILTACVRLHHIVAGAHELPGLARFRTQALGWKVLSGRECEIVIGTDEHAIFVQDNRSR